MRVLVVDDEAIVLDSCRRVLEADGFEVLLAPSVEEALKTIDGLTETGPLLLLIDVKLPVHDGMYLMRKVKEKRPRLPVIVMSGYPTAETIQAAEQLGAVTFIAKPFTPDELLETLRSVLKEGETHDPQENIGN
jgi:DNA-binding NtrC family response regulator